MVRHPKMGWVSLLVTRIAWMPVAVALLLWSGCHGDPVDTRAPLRVATTADHPPFSIADGDTYRGISIDLANDLAASLGRPLLLVRTSWESLIADAVDRRFDVAMSGIHVTSDRAAAGEFTEPYLTIGKLAVVRCSDIGRFQSLEDVSRLGASILTIRGSSNVHFARTHFPNSVAMQVLGIDEAFNALATGNGDVVFADAPHAGFRTNSDPRLCIGLRGTPLGNYAVAIFLPRESSLLETVDRWLEQRRGDGFVERVLEAHVPSAGNAVQVL